MKKITIALLAAVALFALASVAFPVQTTKVLDVMAGGLKLLDDQVITFGTGGDATIGYDETTSDRTLFTSAAGSGLNIRTGNLYVGNGTPDQTVNGEDAYIEGLLEVDGVAYCDGGVKIGDDIDLAFGATSDVTVKYDETTTDRLTLTSAAAGGLNVLTGNLFVGNGTPGQTINGEDMYVEGISEHDGMCYFDGGATIATSATLSYATASTAPFINSSKALVTGAFSLASGANTACNTTCTASKVCVFGFDNGSADAEAVVACDDATADVCICLGAAS